MATVTRPEFRKDWGGEVREHWPAMLQEYAGVEDLRFLEVGCFEGRTTLWLLTNVLTHPSSTITVVDTFAGSPEFKSMGISTDFKQRFLSNIARHADQVIVCEGSSRDVLPALDDGFDFIFVDGSHVAEDVWADATGAWPLLKPGGLLAFDDYEWGDGGPSTPRPAIDRFLAEYASEMTVYRLGYQCVVRKI